MKELFANVLELSLTGSYAILFVLAARLLLRRAPKSYSYALWLLPLIRLVCPVTFTSNTSLMPPQQRIILPQTMVTPPPTAITELPPAAVEAAKTGPTAMTVLAWLWLAGVFFLLVWSVVSYLRLHRRVAGAEHLEGRVYQCTAVSSPFVLGFFAPKIYLPMGLGAEEKRYILEHEEIHIRRLDFLVKPLAYLTLCLHWFNPLCWLAFFCYCRDMEMSCDEAVLGKLGGEARTGYSDSLLAVAVAGRFPFGGGPLAFGESGVGQRIKNVLHYKKPTLWVAWGAGFVLCLLVMVLLPDPKSAPITPPPASSSSEPAGAAEPAGAGEAATQIVITPQPKLTEQQQLDLMNASQIAFRSWTQPADIEPDSLIQFYTGLTGVDDRLPWELPNAKRDPESGEPLMPAALVDAVVPIYFAVSDIQLHQASYYRTEEKAYLLPGLGGTSSCTYTSTTPTQGGVVLNYDAKSDGRLFARGKLTVAIDADGGYKYLSNEITETTGDENEVYYKTLSDRYLDGISVLGIFSYSWDSPEALKPEDFTQYYLLQYTRREDVAKRDATGTDAEILAKIPDPVFEVDGRIYVREAELENAVRQRFDAAPATIRKAPEYRSDLKAYLYEGWGFGGGGSIRVTASWPEEGNVLGLKFETYGGMIEEIFSSGTVRVAVDGDKFKYLSCEVDG